MGVRRRKTAAEKKVAAPKKTASVGSPKARARAASSIVRIPTKEQADSTSALTSRVLFRRNTDHQVDRCMQLKLGMYPRAQLEQHLNSSGKNIASAIKGEIYRLRGSRLHMPLQFWKDMIIDHRLSGCLMDGLQKPQQSEKVNKDVDLALKEAHHENPSKKSCALNKFCHENEPALVPLFEGLHSIASELSMNPSIYCSAVILVGQNSHWVRAHPGFVSVAFNIVASVAQHVQVRFSEAILSVVRAW